MRAEKIVSHHAFSIYKFPRMYFARMHQERSCVAALEGAGTIKGMYIGDGEDSLSFRQYDKYILLGGQAYRTGENRNGGRYDRLKATGKRYIQEAIQ